MLTERQANLIAATLEELRPGDWRIQQTLDVLWENRHTPHDFKTLIQVATNAALNPTMKSPTGIYLDGKHWDLPEPPKHRPKNPKCPDHDWYDAHNCHACDADIQEGNRPEQFRGHKMPKTPGARPANWKELTQTNNQPQPTNTPPASTEPAHDDYNQPERTTNHTRTR
ncbi:hypothetical protein [Glutamicibacter ardleyensis]|uniref:hypothetical protein n=1 Tax=Glutamicibacter ardleyensis TaxID=225894 RepID=UPI003FD4AFE9